MPGEWTVGRYLVDRLREVGVRHIFGVPGDYVLGLMDDFVAGPIALVGTCNELNAGYAADAYARVNGVGAVCVTYAVGGFYEEGANPLACVDELAGFVEKGFRAVKLKTGALGLATELERVRAVRAAIGPDVLLMLDMNAPYDVEGCIGFARAMEPENIFWLEEPLHWYLQPADFVRLAAATRIPLAHGEREWHHYTVRDFVDSGAIRYVQFDGTRHGGFTEALRIAEYAAQKGVMIAPHTAAQVSGSEWIHAYPRELAAFPLPSLKLQKYWPPVSRVDNVYGDKNVFCACIPVDAYKDEAADA